MSHLWSLEDYEVATKDYIQTMVGRGVWPPTDPIAFSAGLREWWRTLQALEADAHATRYVPFSDELKDIDQTATRGEDDEDDDAPI